MKLKEAIAKIKELEDELATTDKLLERRNELLYAIPACPAHGPYCVPHAIEWVEQVKTLANIVTGAEHPAVPPRVRMRP